VTFAAGAAQPASAAAHSTDAMNRITSFFMIFFPSPI
jgi:hypothetical protein